MTKKALSEITLNLLESELAEGKWTLKPHAIAARLHELDPDFKTEDPTSPEAQAQMVTRLRTLCGRLPDKRTLKNAVAGQTVQGKSVAGVICKALELPLDQLETLATRVQDTAPPPEENTPTPAPEPAATATPNPPQSRSLKPFALAAGLAIAGVAAWLISNPKADGAAPDPGDLATTTQTQITPQTPTHFYGKDGHPMTPLPDGSVQTFATWFKPNPATTNQRGMIFCAGKITNGFDANLQIAWDPKGRVRIAMESPRTPQTPEGAVLELVSPNGSVDPHQWTHIVVMLTPDQDLPLTCLINGESTSLRITKSKPENLDPSVLKSSFPEPLMLSGQSSVTSWPPFQGQLAGAELFPESMTQQQIQALISKTNPGH